MYAQRNIEAGPHNHRCCAEEISITYSECMSVALVIQQAKRMHCSTLSSMAYLDLSCFSTLSHKWQDFLEKGYLI
jgi:hypothetical protein